MNSARTVLTVTVLAALASLPTLAAAGAGLSAIPGEDPAAVRVVLGETNASWQALEGSPTIDGSPAPEAEQPIPEDRIAPWRGYERTIPVELGGEGAVLVLAEGVGLVLETPDVDDADADEETAGGNGTDGTDPGPPASNASSAAAGPATGPAPAEASEGEGSAEGEDDTTPAPQEHRSEDAQDADRWALSERPLWAAGLALAVVLAAAPTAWRLIARDDGPDGDARRQDARPGSGDRVRGDRHEPRRREAHAREDVARGRHPPRGRREEASRETRREPRHRTRPRGAADRERLRR